MMKQLMVFAISCILALSATAGMKETFVCDFKKDMIPQVMAAPCQGTPVANARIVDSSLRIGTQDDGSNARLVYRLNDTRQAARLLGAASPFPLRQGKLSFSFRPVDWQLGTTGFNMLLEVRGPERARLHVTYLLPSTTGKPSVQVCYGTPGAAVQGSRKIPALFPYVALDLEREWHDVVFEWSPAAVELTVDGQSQKLPTSNLELPEQGFFADTLIVGTDIPANVLGQSDIRNLKIETEAVASPSSQGKARPFMVVPVAPAPSIDGIIHEEEYSQALKTTGWLSIPKAHYASHQGIFYFSYDADYIYVALSSQGHHRLPQAQKHDHDANVWEDDSVDFMIDPTPDTPDFYHFIFNWGKAVYDEHVVPDANSALGVGWNGRGVQVETTATDEIWQLEAAIPFETLGKKPRPDMEWAFNFCESNPGDGLYTMINAHSGYLERDKFGVMQFGKEQGPVFRLEALGDLDQGRADILCNADRLELHCLRYDETAMTEFPVFGEEVEAIGGVCHYKSDQDLLGKSGNLYLNAYRQNQLVYSAKYPYQVTEAAAIENLRRVPGENTSDNMLRVTTSQTPDKKTSLLFSLQDSRGETVGVFPKIAVQERRQESLLPLKDIEPGNYKLCMDVVDDNGHVIRSAMGRNLTVFPSALPWTGNTLGISDDVAFPWEPLEVKKDAEAIEVCCWNRRYTFTDNELFPLIESGANAYLASSPRLSAIVGGRESTGKGTSWKIETATRRQAVLRNSGNMAGVGKVEVAATIDYDGFIWFDIAFAQSHAKSLEHLSVDFVMPNHLAKLLNSGYRDLTDTGFLPDTWTKKLFGQFGSFWYGNEEGGLSFGLESDQHWSNKDVGKQLTLHREKDGCHATLNMIDQPTAMPSDFQYGFYVMPTPVRPRPKVARTLRPNHVFGHNGAARQGKDYPDNLSWWTATYSYQGYPEWKTTPEGIQEFADGYAWPIEVQPYWNYDILPSKEYRTAWYAAYSSIGRNAPETIWQGELWRSGDKDKLYGDSLYTYQDDMIEVCKGDDYCDFYLWRLDKSRRENPKIDGIYFDLMMWPSCARPEHNHGYDSPSGRKSTFAIREHRRFLERIYQYLHQNDDESPVVMHMSGATSRIGGFSFSDYFLEGELWCDVLVRDHSYKKMKLSQMRAELLPHIYGQGIIYISQLYRILPFVPAMERKTWKASPWAERHLAGLLLLHDVMPDRTSLNDVALKIWKGLDRFGLTEASEYLPYWETEAQGHRINADGENTAVTIWREADGRELLMFFNNQDTPFDFNMDNCFGRTATDMESGEVLQVNGDALTVPVALRDFRLIELK
ncbi:MAG: DUF6067 family protein [Lentisphaeria bacterium]|nr:DUF6067 family protein [Lentisphaeria bacterium]